VLLHTKGVWLVLACFRGSLLFILLDRTKQSLALRPFSQLSDEITPEHVIVKST
jgi:hypothetical protein